jgi:TonB family protein
VKQSGAKAGDEHRKELFNAFKNISKSSSKEAPEGAADGDVNGDSAQQEGERYFGLLKAQVQRYYDLPNTLSDQERLRLKAHVHIFIGRAGQLLKVKAESSSGNGLFDEAVITATKRASPFPPPPDALREKLQTQGVVLAFTPSGS